MDTGNIELTNGTLYMTDKDGNTIKLGEGSIETFCSKTEIPDSFKYLDMVKDMEAETTFIPRRTKWWDTKDLRKLYGIKWYQWWWIEIRNFFYFLFNEVE